MENKEIINIIGLHKTYAKKTPFEHEALSGVDIKINAGEFVTIIGETGSGKSSLITHINGLTKPSSGEINVYEFKLTNSKKKIRNIKNLRKRVGMVFQFPEYQLFEETVLKDVMFGPKNFGVSKEDAEIKANKYIDQLKLPEETKKRSPFDLSGGQKRKVALAGILAIETDVLIFDEPTAGLDPESEREVLEICKDLNKQGKTIIFVTHNMENVLKYSSRVIVLKEGKVIWTNTPEKTFQNGTLIEEANLDIPQIYNFLQKFHKEKDITDEVRNKNQLVDIALGIKKPPVKKTAAKKPPVKKTATKGGDK